MIPASMTIKRSRLARSSTSFRSLPEEDRTKNTPAAAESRLMERDSVTKCLKHSVMSDDSRSPIGILTVSSPIKESGGRGGDAGGCGGGDGVEAFYEKCALCEKKIDPGDDVFMYSYLRAFCSTDCRNKQIIMDAKIEITSQVKKETKLVEVTSQVKKESKPEPSSNNNAIRLFGVQVVAAHSDPQSHVN